MGTHFTSRRMPFKCWFFLMIVRSCVVSSGSSQEAEVHLNEPCTAVVKEIMGRMDRAQLLCSTPSGKAYHIPYVDTDWIRRKEYAKELFSGETQLQLPPNTLIYEKTQTLVLEAPPKLIKVDTDVARRRLRNLEKTIGTKSLLVVRVRATNGETTPSEAQLANDVFGDGGDVNNMRSQYLACSYGKLEFMKTQDRTGKTIDIRNGIVTVPLGVSTNVGDEVMVNSINTELQKQFSTAAGKIADHIIYCLPAGTMAEWDIAWAFVNDYRSVYNDIECSHVSTQV